MATWDRVSEPDEVKRISNAYEGTDLATVHCPGCGKIVELFFNGGELDTDECCDYVFFGEHIRIDVVVSKKHGN